MAEELTTVQIDTESREKLRILATVNMRSMAAHLRWLINAEYSLMQYSNHRQAEQYQTNDQPQA